MNTSVNRRKRAARILGGSLLAAGITAALAGFAPAADRPNGPGSVPFSTSGYLEAVAAPAADSAWAVGGSAGKTLILHWNGTAWKVVKSPTPAGGAALAGVAAVSARDAWAIGGSPKAGAPGLILHWNGNAWKTSDSPAAEFLSGVTAVSADSAWVVGTTSRGKPLILHWNGRSWKSAHVPTTAQGNLWGVTALSPRIAWAVGDTNGAPLILHWNGTAWKVVKPPSGWMNYSGYWRGVAAVSAKSAWAVTSSPCPGCSGTQGGIYHWNGSAWKLAGRTGAPSGSAFGGLTVVAASSARSAWAVGASTPGGPLIMHWNGSTWKIAKRPAGAPTLASVAAFSATDAWVVGSTSKGETLILHWNGTTWK